MDRGSDRLVRHTCKELAGQHYDSHERTSLFRRTWPDQRQYINHNWPHFHKLAIEALARMLTHPGTRDDLKETIYEALINDRKKADGNPLAIRPLQATLEPVEKEDRQFIDSNPLPVHKGM